MRIKKIELRGAIGIFKGTGKEELSIDFTQYDSGLIAIIGGNGAGKSTLVENLHPYRRLVSRDGGLAEHFYLKDSYRKLTFEIDDIEYRSEIYIDGLTKKVEAYLFKDNIAQNDGKPTTYDSVIVELLGSDNLFFNSVFSAQLSENIGMLSVNERRELFYEFLGLNKYEKYCEVAKGEVKKLEAQVSKEIGIVEFLKEKIEGIQFVKDENLQLAADLETQENELKEIEDIHLDNLAEQREVETLLTVAKNNLSAMVAKQDEINKTKQIISEAENNKRISLAKIDNEEKEALSKLHNVDERVEKLKSELQGYLEELNSTDIISRSEIEEVEIKLQRTKESIEILKELIAKEPEFRTQLSYKEELKAKAAEISTEQINLNDELNKEQRNEKLELAGLIPLNEEENELRNNISILTNKKTNILIEKDVIEARIRKELESINFETETIDAVPCTKASLTGITGEWKEYQVCPFLVKAFDTKNKLPETQKQHEAEKAKIELSLINSTKEFSDNLKKHQEKLTELNEKTKIIVEKYEKIYGQILAKKDKLKVISDSTQYELNNFDTAIEANIRSIEDAKVRIATAEAELIKYKELVIEKEKAYQNAIDYKEIRKEMLQGKIEKIEKAIKNESGEIESEILKIRQETEQKKFIAVTQIDSMISENKKQLEKLSKEIDTTISGKIAKYELELEAIIRNLEQSNTSKLHISERISAIKNKMLSNNLRIADSEKTELQIKEKEAEIKKINDDILDYTFLVKALDKTGIPVLKLEVSGKEVTAITNDLLTNFNSDFRVVFETTKLTKDKKKMKEIFNINVVDKEGVTELKNKSVGQQAWIDTAIKLAIGLILRQQGKNIRTSFLDEKDGAFDIENALNYRRMIEEAHRRSGVYNTFIITHREEIKNLIDQKILLKNCGI